MSYFFRRFSNLRKLSDLVSQNGSYQEIPLLILWRYLMDFVETDEEEAVVAAAILAELAVEPLAVFKFFWTTLRSPFT